MREHRELERTYAPGAGASLPDLTALPGVTALGEPEVIELSAAYYDTDDLALLRAGVTLRRRTGGADEGWHLKIPAGVGRDEIQLPLASGPAAPPAELLGLVRGRTRGAPVAEVATVCTRRIEVPLLDAEGTVVAELADDEVTGQAHGREQQVAWREWELELVDGDPALLGAADDLLHDAGVPSSDIPRKILHVLGDRLPEPRRLAAVGPDKPAGRVLQRRLAEQVEELVRRDSEIRRGRPEGVHQARVACRRLRAALATYRPLVHREVTDPLREELKWLGQALADARDAHVVRRRLEVLLDEEPPEPGSAAAHARLAASYDERRQGADRRVDEVLSSDRYFDLLDALDRLVEDPPWTAEAVRPARELLRRRMRRDWKRLRRQVAVEVDAVEHDPAMHQVRKDAKRLRYAAEALEPVWGKDAGRLTRAAKKLTSHLGDRQDTVVSRQHLRQLAEEAEAAGESSFVWGRLHAHEEARAADLDRRWPGLWSAVSRKRYRAWLG
ncbi:CYTH and CHAD domain-containing protein [Nocardioides koreensis]|uniref:CYTH and CHAD domain-containing protein n=1 Tax=Nocardioides koreensis TaxID=433651 RepID=A0ABN2ZZ51_9ACTN